MNIAYRRRYETFTVPDFPQDGGAHQYATIQGPIQGEHARKIPILRSLLGC
jgi:hypothetical protein